MKVTEGLAAALEGGPTNNPDEEADAPRFRCLAYWLSKCSEVVYPPKGEGEASKNENAFDLKADKAKKAYREKRPWWKALFEKTAPQEAAEKAWSDAEADWAQAAKARIAGAVKGFWGAPSGELTVGFYSSYGTQYFLAKDDKNIVVSFRGTEEKKFSDIFADLLSIQATGPKDHKGKVHLGFWTALDHVWTDVKGSGAIPLPDLIKTERDKNNQKVWFTGHSLGGALATLAADRMIVQGKLDPEDIGGVFTYGQPRVGNGKFAAKYELKDRHYRFIYNNDLVTKVPPTSLWFLSLIFGKFFKKSSQQNAEAAPDASSPKTNAKKSSTMSYRHVGRVAIANRAGEFKLLKKGFLWWRIQLFFARLWSRLKAPFLRREPDGVKPDGVMKRLLPGVSDHGIANYVKYLKQTAEDSK